MVDALRWREFFEVLPMSAAVLDEHGAIVAVNAAWRQFAEGGGASEDFVGARYLDHCAANVDAAATIQRALAGVPGMLVYDCHDPETQRWMELRALPLSDGAAIVHVDVTSRVQAEEAVGIDPLTGLLTREAFEAEVERRRARSSDPLGLVFVDLDGFKHVNDRFGHQLGDRVLHIAAERIRRTVRDEDLVARYGGDEFIAAVRLDQHGDVHPAVERIEAALDEPIVVGSARLHDGGSAGATAIRPGEPLADAVRRADTAMYQRKNRRRTDAGPLPASQRHT